MTHPFEKFLKDFSSTYQDKFIKANKAMWLLETTGLQDAADLKAILEAELKIFLSDESIYEKLLKWNDVKDPLLKRALDVLKLTFEPNLMPEKFLREISEKEADLAREYSQFRAKLDGKFLSENEIRDLLKTEKDVSKRKKIWEASKQIGPILAPKILELVHLRNKLAREKGYSDYFEMQLKIQEVDPAWLDSFLDSFSKKSDGAFSSLMKGVHKHLSEKFSVSERDLGPWAFSEPFSQEDPIDSEELDQLASEINLIDASVRFFDEMGLSVHDVLKKSDMYEREGKNQHAFCVHMDREGDVRTLNNVKPCIKWLEIVLHEFGHAVYDLKIDANLPWVLKEPPHMITTEAMALLMGRQAYLKEPLLFLGCKDESLLKKAEESLKRRQMIFSRWVLVMTDFEKELYRNPDQDLNGLWWDLVEKYQKIQRPSGREKEADWATKYHMGLAPVYYFSYLLGEFFASSIQKALLESIGSKNLYTKEAGLFLEKRLFKPGNRMPWDKLIEFTTGKPIEFDAWLNEFSVSP